MAETKAKTLTEGMDTHGSTAFSPTGTEVTERTMPPGFDTFSVLPEERKAFGVQDNETLAWVRNPSHWEKLEHSDRVREFSHERPGARQVFKDGVDPVTHGDLLLMAYPTVHKEREEEARTAEYKHYVEHEDPNSKPRDREKLERLRESMHRQHEREGIIGPQSPTQGLSYEQALSKYSKEQIDAEEARFRRGTRQQSFDSEDWAKMVDRGRRDTSAQGRTRAVAVGDTGLGKTTQQKVAARQAGGNR
jgi:flagellar biosynthesis GTPase FlhF